MDFELSEDQVALQDAARGLLDDISSATRLGGNGPSSTGRIPLPLPSFPGVTVNWC